MYYFEIVIAFLPFWLQNLKIMSVLWWGPLLWILLINCSLICKSGGRYITQFPSLWSPNDKIVKKMDALTVGMHKWAADIPAVRLIYLPLLFAICHLPWAGVKLVMAWIHNSTICLKIHHKKKSPAKYLTKCDQLTIIDHAVTAGRLLLPWDTNYFLSSHPCSKTITESSTHC